MPTISFYGIYRGMEPHISLFLKKQAKKNGSFAVAIDVMFFRPTRHFTITPRSIASFLVENARHFFWHIKEAFRGHIIIPVPSFVFILVLGKFFLRQNKIALPATSAAELYRIKWPNRTIANEFMATYLRYAALQDELYGLHTFSKSLPLLYHFYQAYNLILSFLFGWLRPSTYVSLYSAYLHHFTPCLQATQRHIPVLVLGCYDCLYRIDDAHVPPQFRFLSSQDVTHYREDHAAINLGREILNQRIKGSVDPAIQYMSSSPFSRINTDEFWNFSSVADSLYEYFPAHRLGEEKQRSSFVVIFMHELQDWHHNGVLPPYASSFFEWLYTTVVHLSSHAIPFVIKIHPAIVLEPKKYYQSINALCQIKSHLSRMIPVSTSLTTVELSQIGMDLGLTVCGTVGLELAYLRLRFLCAGTPPYGSLFPRRTELDRKAYLHRLLNFLAEPAVSAEESTAAAFYVGYQHRMLSQPVIHLERSSMTTSNNAEFLQVKTYL